MARPAKTKTHLENLVITPKTAHGDADGDTVFAIYPIDSDDINGTPTAVFSINENGGITVSGTSLTGAENITSLVVADTTTTTGNSVAITSTAITTGDALEIFVDTDTVTTGKAINVISGANYGAATSKFSVDEDGDTLVAGTLGVSGAVTLRSSRVPLIKRTVTDYDAQAATLTIEGLLGGIVTQNSKTGASTATTPTGTEISAGIAGVSVGDSFSCLYYNRGDQTSTITAGAPDVTVYGTAAVPAKKTAELIFHCTAADTWSCYVVLSA